VEVLMLNRSVALAVMVTLAGAVCWAGCSGDAGSAPGAVVDPDAGTPNGNDAGAEDSGGDPVDSGTPEDSGPAATVDITYGTCPTFTKCGGDIVGSWKVTGGCVSSDVFAEAKAQCDGLQESDVVIKASGTVVATATKVQRTTTLTLSGKVAVPKSCAQGVSNCAFIGAALQSGAIPGAPKFDTATCTDGGALCNCTVATTVDEKKDDAYTAADGVVTTTDPTRTYDYCVDGNKMTYKETTPPAQGAFALPVIVEVGK